MFTGIVSAVGSVAEVSLKDKDGTYRFATGKLDMSNVKLGGSISVSGACLTVTTIHADGFSADLSRETLDCTTLGERKPGDAVNLERALALGEELGGHLVTGHVDGVGEVVAIAGDGDSVRLEVAVPPALARYVAAKGSICIDGVSLTVNSVAGETAGVMIVPHTQEQTIIGGYAPGTLVNIEVDLIARYLERIVQYTGTTD